MPIYNHTHHRQISLGLIPDLYPAFQCDHVARRAGAAHCHMG